MDGSLTRLYRIYDNYEKRINTPGARHNIPMALMIEIRNELSRQNEEMKQLKKQLEGRSS